MAQSLCQLYVHIVFSTKGRARDFEDRTMRERMHAYLVGTCRNLESPSINVGGVEDHVHVLCRLAKTRSISELVRELKRESSKWVKGLRPELESFAWQNGYGAFSISPGHVESVKEYIANQEDRHREESFQEEFLRLLAKYEIEYDVRYVWD